MDGNKAKVGVFWSAAERFSTIGIQFVLNIIIARILSPSDYGIIGMLSIFLSISQCLVDSGFANALVQTKKRTDKDYGTVFLFNIAISVILYLILFISAPAIARFYNLEILTTILRVVGLNLILSALSIVQKTILTIKVDFKTQAFVTIPGALISGIVGIIMAYIGFGVWSLVAQTLTYSLILAILFWVLSHDRFIITFDISSFKRLGGFGVKLMFSGLLNTAYNNLYALFIGKKYKAEELGYYTRADQFAVFPATTLTDIISRVSYPLLCQNQSDKIELSRVYTSFIKNSCFLIFPLMIGLSVLSKPLIIILLTEKWLPAASLMMILAIEGIFSPITRINLNLLQAVGRSDLFLNLEIVKKIISIGILLFTLQHGVFWICVGRLVYALIALLINMYYTEGIIGKSYIEQFCDWLPTLFAAVIMGICVYLISLLFTSAYLQIIIGLIFGIAVYIIMAFLLKLEARNILISQVKKIRLNR